MRRILFVCGVVVFVAAIVFLSVGKPFGMTRELTLVSMIAVALIVCLTCLHENWCFKDAAFVAEYDSEFGSGFVVSSGSKTVFAVPTYRRAFWLQQAFKIDVGDVLPNSPMQGTISVELVSDGLSTLCFYKFLLTEGGEDGPSRPNESIVKAMRTLLKPCVGMVRGALTESTFREMRIALRAHGLRVSCQLDNFGARTTAAIE